MAYTLRFFFEYGAGGCLWVGNEAAYEQFGDGPLDAGLYDADGRLTQKPAIDLPVVLKNEVEELDRLYGESIDWANPAAGSLWNEAQQTTFTKRAKALFEAISSHLRDEFELDYCHT